LHTKQKFISVLHEEWIIAINKARAHCYKFLCIFHAAVFG